MVTTNPYGMARVWAYCDGRELAAATAAFDTNKPPLGELVAWILRLVDQRELFVKLNKPLAVIAFGRRRLEPWSDEPPKPVSFEKPSQELEPVESGE